MNKRLFNIMAIALLCMGHSLISKAQVTYFDTNNFLLNYFTNTGSSAYDWRFEPQKAPMPWFWPPVVMETRISFPPMP